ncbi:unnamed protein product [Urochloa decumbens]|uniref:F-box domain-containing protein n=1 Tax=Urochloa decumbens TaxID=240449 RepID=A0ABC9A0L0_9POAL
MAPPLPPPELPDDAVAEILLRLPPDEPRCLFRASLVCKLWQRLLTDAAFLRRYRRFHRTPPLLGYFFTGEVRGEIAPFFIPTTPASPFPKPMLDCRPWMPLDCRHGRVLLQKVQGGDFTVWDPITGGREEVPEPRTRSRSFSVAVLCATAGCDHRGCHGDPFLFVWVWTGAVKGLAHALVYSSQLGCWGMVVSVGVGADDFLNANRGALVGDHIYFMLQMGARILKYDLVKHHLSVIDPPESYECGIFIVPTEDGFLGVAGISGTTLHLWSRKANSKGVERWVQYRVIELRTLLPADDRFKTAIVVAFAESVRVIFVCTEIGHFIIDLRSEQARKVSKRGVQYPIIPFVSFYTPGSIRLWVLFLILARFSHITPNHVNFFN